MIERLGRYEWLLLDPASERRQQPECRRNALRLIKPELWIAAALCPHLGCVPPVRGMWRRPTLAPTGRAAFTAPATVRSSISPVECSSKYRRRSIWKYVTSICRTEQR